MCVSTSDLSKSAASSLHFLLTFVADTLRHTHSFRFNIYIWDYCVKRGYNNTARELIAEAKLESNPARPIDAKKGLLYE